MVKPRERNSRYVDAVMTVPKSTLFPMCGMNLAFERDIIGPAMYFGLMGESQGMKGVQGPTAAASAWTSPEDHSLTGV